jgi:hypothetical protein
MSGKEILQHKVLNFTKFETGRIKCTCFDVTSQFILFGASIGSVYVYLRDSLNFKSLAASVVTGSIKILRVSLDGSLVALATEAPHGVVVMEHNLRDSNKIAKWRVWSADSRDLFVILLASVRYFPHVIFMLGFLLFIYLFIYLFVYYYQFYCIIFFELLFFALLISCCRWYTSLIQSIQLLHWPGLVSTARTTRSTRRMRRASSSNR